MKRPTYPRGEDTDGHLIGRSVPDQRRNGASIPPEHRIARVKSALKALLKEAKSGQHRYDRQGQECPPMEEAIERAEEVLYPYSR